MVRALGIVVVLLTCGFASMVAAQNAVTKAPTAADWAALAKLPDFTGVWERGGVGGGGGGGARGARGQAQGAQPQAAPAQGQRQGQTQAQGRGAAGGRGGM